MPLNISSSRSSTLSPPVATSSTSSLSSLSQHLINTNITNVANNNNNINSDNKKNNNTNNNGEANKLISQKELILAKIKREPCETNLNFTESECSSTNFSEMKQESKLFLFLKTVIY